MPHRDSMPREQTLAPLSGTSADQWGWARPMKQTKILVRATLPGELDDSVVLGAAPRCVEDLEGVHGLDGRHRELGAPRRAAANCV
jgi:hypothetical protein